MNRILTIALSALMLAGCADGYDKSAVPTANASLDQSLQDCNARVATENIKTYFEMAKCNLAAEQAFFTAIKLKRMDTFEAYSINYRMLAVAQDANRISPRQARRDAEKILDRFYAECKCVPAQFGPARFD